MNNSFDDLALHLQPLLEKLSSGERTKLARKVGRDVRNNQHKRISAQQNSDGSNYAPRRERLRNKKGKIKRQMFAKLKLNRNLKVDINSDSIAIGFIGRVARIARVHQYGLKDRAAPKAPNVTYHKRELIGFTKQDLKMIEDSSLKHINI